jgi:type I restriction-modification system DNA methylase subunit
MAYTFDQSKDEIARLVKHFETNRAAFLASAYKEAQARQEFIDPLFIALNWDVHNQQQTAPDYREVVVEDSLEMPGHEARKAPDYVFRVGRERKFFAEAKKPGVDLKMAAGPAYQLRRYAWSAKLPLSVLTDFHEWAAYDCRIRPSEGDKTSTARLAYMTYEEYADRWREVWDVFSREAVWGGSFDQFAQGSKGKRGTSEVDAEFLKEIEGWRNLLAHNIAIRNPDLTLDEMNDAVQRTIDRIIFLRMVEARGMEEYGQLQRIAESEDIYAELLALSKKADAKYNSGLFDFSKVGDQITPLLTVDDKTLKPILADLYFPKSPYEFSVLPAEILGNVYEQFLGKVIRLTASHQAKVEEKPEVKKAGGVYYTPSYIVEYIVKNTVGKQIEGKSPAQLNGFRVLDPACGSGSFLLGAYTLLLEYYHDWYIAHEPGKHKEAVAQQPDGSWQLTLPERKRILTEHIFGVDIDRQAVEVTKLSLLLKVLEGLKQLALFSERALPNLDSNIKCGNSLIGPDYFAGRMMPDNDELRRVNPFDWQQGFSKAMQAGGFDCVIGNPPYGAELSDEIKSYISINYHVTQYKFDSYGFFIEAGLRLLKNNASLLGLIVPNSWLDTKTYSRMRSFLLQNSTVTEIVNLGGSVFQATVDTALLFLSKPRVINSFIKIIDASSVDKAVRRIASPIRVFTIKQSEWEQDAEYRFNVFANENELALFKKIRTQALTIDEIGDVSQGLIPYNSKEVSAQNPYISPTRGGKEWKPFLDNGSCIARYELTWNGLYVKYGKWLYTANQPKFYENPKILIQRHRNPSLSRRVVATFDEAKYYFKDNLCCVIARDGGLYNLQYLLGVLNSTLTNYYYKKNYTEVSLNPVYIRQIPIRRINFADPTDKSQHDNMVALVEQMLDLHKRKAEAKDAGEQERLQRVIDSTDQQIDALVYELYELTPEEIAIVEETTVKREGT